MIKNERQYRITRAQAKRFERALAETRANPAETAGVGPQIRAAIIEGMESQLEDLRQQLAEYEALNSGQRRVFEAHAFSELPRALIQSRIALRLSQKELAQRLGLKEQQIQRYEASDYAGANLQRLNEVIQALGVQVKEEVLLPDIPPGR